MSYIFRIHKSGNTQLKAWERSEMLHQEAIATIPDTIQQGMASKIGSSIPSPFARMYLFDAAFQIASNQNTLGNSMYHQLVSDCLDMYQFLFLNADSGEVTFKKWDKEERLAKLRASSFPEHHSLANTLELFFKGEKFKNTNEIYLIYYRNKLVGGTSPITGLYTSPNWQRIMNENGWQFKTSGGNVLFDNDPLPIHQRDKDFIRYMYRFVYAYNDILSTQSEAFFNYFQKARQKYAYLKNDLDEQQLNVDYTARQFQEDYDAIEIDPNDDSRQETLRSGAYQILKQKAANIIQDIQQNSDFLLAATKEYYRERIDQQGIPVNDPLPLVLIQGNHQMKYIDAPWDEKLRVDDVPSIPLHKRKLPGPNLRYPYVTTGDFLEDVLIEMPYYLDKEYFYTGFEGKFKYLLPIKRAYFNYFGLEDLEKQLTIRQTENSVSVKLDIPIRNQQTITLSRTFDLNSENDVSKQKVGEGFNLGIFPFYKITNDPTQNKYNVGLFNNIEDLKLDFLKFEQVINDASVKTDTHERSRTERLTLGSTYYKIENDYFDCIEVSIGGSIVSTNGLIIPNFKQVTTDSTSREFSFAVDFGTTNTFVVYNTNRQTEGLSPLDITPSDRQAVYLSEISDNQSDLQNRIRTGAGNLGSFVGIANREFLPAFMGKDMAYTLPFRTAICEFKPTYVEGQPVLFGNMNIGFGLERDFGEDNRDNEYVTNIKWMIKNQKAGAPKDRIEMFFRELVWMMKNKILLNNGSLKANLVWMVPLSMKRKTRSTFEDIWKTQIAAIFGKDHEVNLVMKYESIVPYYALPNLRRSADVVNIDIGGGTTDVFFFAKSQKSYYSTSFKFAGNDIWGEGLTEFGNPSMDNGFYQMMDDQYVAGEIQSLNSRTALIYDTFKSNPSLNSADMCALMFRYDDQFKFSDHIKNNEPLSSILFIHLGAVLYHIAQIIVEKNLDIPEYISFTGKGSEYIKLISSRKEDIQHIVVLFLEVFTGKKAPRSTQINIVDNPKEITAEGAISQKSFSDKEQIDDNVEIFTHFGIEAGESKKDYYHVQDLEAIRPALEQQFDDFLEKMQDINIVRLIKEYDVSWKYDGINVINYLKEISASSYREVVYDIGEPDDELEETPFFWFLKDSLYRLSQELYKIQSA